MFNALLFYVLQPLALFDLAQQSSFSIYSLPSVCKHSQTWWRLWHPVFDSPSLSPKAIQALMFSDPQFKDQTEEAGGVNQKGNDVMTKITKMSERVWAFAEAAAATASVPDVTVRILSSPDWARMMAALIQHRIWHIQALSTFPLARKSLLNALVFVS